MTEFDNVIAEQLTETYTVPLLNERSATHGNYDDTARIAWRLKNVIRTEIIARTKREQSAITYRQLESLDMISSKIARIIAGDPHVADHWDDIAGYAKLVSEKL